MTFLKKYQQFIAGKNLFSKKDHLLLAVSGGVDSVVLCELCHQCGFTFSIAHCNFQLRGKESERDEQFVTSLAKKYQVPFYCNKFDTEQYAKENKLSIQVAARELRYNWFNEIIRIENKSEIRNSKSKIVTAHHSDDSIETLLMNFFKGTGIKGLHGILPKQGNIIRPLLFAGKEEITHFAKDNKLDSVEDSSNESDKYTRNFFRNKLIPQIEEVFPQVKQNLLRNMERFEEVEIIYRNSIELLKKKLTEKKGAETHIPVLKLKNTEPVHTIIFEIISEFNFTPSQTDEVIKLLESESGKFILSATHRLLKNRNWLIISPLDTKIAETILIENEGKVNYPEGIIELKRNPESEIRNLKSLAQLDASKVSFPLLLRKWKTGDYFYPLGMQKKKKLSRFFIDQKLSLPDKEKTWVLESDKKIIWVVGMRMDDRFKVTEKTKEVLILSFKNADS